MISNICYKCFVLSIIKWEVFIILFNEIVFTRTKLRCLQDAM